MRIPPVILVLVASFSLTPAVAKGNEWRGIVPLQSTRATVEAALGKSDDPCGCRFNTVTESVVIDYSKGTCKGPPYGWNVPAGTVLQITVYPTSELFLRQLNLDPTKYVRSKDASETTIHYTSVDLGVKYSVQDDRIHSITYIPSKTDSSLRCKGFPEYDGGLREYYAYSSFSKKAQLIDERLSEFALQLANNLNVVGYVITYGGAVSKKGEARAMGEYAKRVISAKSRVSQARVIVIDGGFRQDAEFELFLVPKGMLAPAPTPTLATNQVKIVAHFRRHLATAGILSKKLNTTLARRRASRIRRHRTSRMA
jgi:hypothetical protein